MAYIYMCVCVCENIILVPTFWAHSQFSPYIQEWQQVGFGAGFFMHNPPPLPEPAPSGPVGPVPSCYFKANRKAPKPNPKMNKNNYSISFIFFYMANKIILNKFITHLNNVMSAFKFFFKKKKINFLILKEKRKENLNQKNK